jgi:hypothetical protein
VFQVMIGPEKASSRIFRFGFSICHNSGAFAFLIAFNPEIP